MTEIEKLQKQINYLMGERRTLSDGMIKMFEHYCGRLDSFDLRIQELEKDSD